MGTHHRLKIYLLIVTYVFLKNGVGQHWLAPCPETPRIPEVENLSFLHPKHHRTLCVGCYDVLIGFCWNRM
jgi:hypothetical protein